MQRRALPLGNRVCAVGIFHEVAGLAQLDQIPELTPL
jgi:hypothetical protein